MGQMTYDQVKEFAESGAPVFYRTDKAEAVVSVVKPVNSEFAVVRFDEFRRGRILINGRQLTVEETCAVQRRCLFLPT